MAGYTTTTLIPGIKQSDNPDRRAAVKVTASHLNVLLELIKRSGSDTLQGDEFQAAKVLMLSIQTQAGTFIDKLHTASTIDDLIQINKEFYHSHGSISS